MVYVYFCVAWIVGGLIFAFTIVPVLIIIFFSIPYTISLNKSGKMNTYAPIFQNLVSLIFLGLIYFIVLWLISRYLSTSWFWGFLFGSGIALLFSLGKLGKNSSNLSDYMDNYSKYIKEETK